MTDILLIGAVNFDSTSQPKTAWIPKDSERLWTAKSLYHAHAHEVVSAHALQILIYGLFEPCHTKKGA